MRRFAPPCPGYNHGTPKLGEIYRVPIMLFYYEDMKVQEIADVLELPKGTVLSRLSRGRDILRKELRDYGV